MASLAQRHERKLEDVLSRFDRVVITGTLPYIGHARANARELTRREIRIFDYARFVDP